MCSPKVRLLIRDPRVHRNKGQGDLTTEEAVRLACVLDSSITLLLSLTDTAILVLTASSTSSSSSERRRTAPSGATMANACPGRRETRHVAAPLHTHQNRNNLTRAKENDISRAIAGEGNVSAASKRRPACPVLLRHAHNGRGSAGMGGEPTCWAFSPSGFVPNLPSPLHPASEATWQRLARGKETKSLRVFKVFFPACSPRDAVNVQQQAPPCDSLVFPANVAVSSRFNDRSGGRSLMMPGGAPTTRAM